VSESSQRVASKRKRHGSDFFSVAADAMPFLSEEDEDEKRDDSG